MSWKICLSDLDFDQRELDAVAEVLRSKWLTMGDGVRAFEERLAEQLGAKHVLLVANCTAALHMAHLAVGVGAGDEVVGPSLTFVATANAARYCGAKPVFADITSETDLNVSPADVAARITPKTRAICVMHYGGYPVDMAEIDRIARQHSLPVIEDAAHAPGASLGGRMVGTLGDVGCFSFFSNKNLVTGEGGALATNDDGIAEELRLLRSHGMTTLTLDRHKGRAASYDVVRLGYNYRPTEITAALAGVQLDKLMANNWRRRELTERYRERLAEVEGIVVPFADHSGESSCHIMPIVLPRSVDRPAVMESLKSQGIQSSIHYPPIHLFSAFRGSTAAQLSVTERVADRELTLPLHPLLEEAAVDAVVRALAEALETAAART